MAPISGAYLHSVPSYDRMTQMADLVAIATAISRQEVNSSSVLPGVKRNGQRIAAVEIHTTFEPLVIFKGQLGSKSNSFTLVHFREAAPPKSAFRFAGPRLIDFQPSDG